MHAQENILHLSLCFASPCGQWQSYVQGHNSALKQELYRLCLAIKKTVKVKRIHLETPLRSFIIQNTIFWIYDEPLLAQFYS